MMSPDQRLASLLTQASLDPASKRLTIGLEGLNPIEALNRLTSDPLTMSVALHELTHYHSLMNRTGVIFACRGTVRGALADAIQHAVLQRELDDSLVQVFLQIHVAYGKMLNAWRPLLEGIALFMQLSDPYAPKQEDPLPLVSLLSFGLARGVLKHDPAVRLLTVDKITSGLGTAARMAMEAGPGFMMAPDRTLASALETGTDTWGLPYFLGYAYIRAVQSRLMRSEKGFAAPDACLRLLLRILQYSWTELLGRDTRWDRMPDVNRLYGWLELIETAPASRVRELLSIEEGADPLTWLRDGVIVRRSPLASTDLAAFLHEVIPTEAQWYTADPTIEAEIHDAIRHTFRINFSAQGLCRIAGWLPQNQPPHTHVLALLMGDECWWLHLAEDQLPTLGLSLSALPRLADRSYPHGRPTSAAPTLPQIEIAAFVEQMLEPAGNLGDDPLSDIYFDFRVAGHNEPVLIAKVEADPSHATAVLKALPQEVCNLHIAGERAMAMMSRVPPLGALAEWLKKNGYHESARKADIVAQGEPVIPNVVAALWTSRILTGLLGRSPDAPLLTELTARRLAGVLPDIDLVHQALTGTYTTARGFTGEGLQDLMYALDLVNRQANRSLGHALFDLTDLSQVRYLGLWGSPVKVIVRH